ncbi:unnamed protein product [Bursaphelenchus xylophilus]|uniref:(pine wood nematode) hypothetical protein n=1 Tax=Bursaphelenchus xylophilus TaxID=6326 RepID=A0A7I8XNU2_BURXY|nr:unnamed protein product [Bursaphelenchus xylophilus]CAG9120984.1 unnamed protein product [Bursaphelenchus xylophilus]
MVDFAPFGGIHSFVGFSGAVDGRPFVVFKSMVFQLSNMRLLLLLVALLVVISAVEAGGWCWGRKDCEKGERCTLFFRCTPIYA